MQTKVDRAKSNNSLSGRLAAVLVFLLLLAVGRVVSTYSVFNHTFDEGAHIATGIEWLEKGSYTIETLHPPLARISVALGPYLNGSRGVGEDIIFEEGNAILYQGRYQENLTLARLGVLPFFLLLGIVVFLWSRRLFGNLAGVFAVTLLTGSPIILAHSGLATTDIPFTAVFVAALFCLTLWFDRPTPGRAILAGFVMGLALVTKHSTLLFLPAAVVVVIGLEYRAARRCGGELFSRLKQDGLASAVALMSIVACSTIWATYRFSTASLREAYQLQFEHLDPAEREGKLEWTLNRLLGTGTLRNAAEMTFDVPIPAPEYVTGVVQLLNKQEKGRALSRPAFLLGKIHGGGVWYFFPVLLFFKSPFPFLVFVLLGIICAWRSPERTSWRQTWTPPACAGAILLLCLPVSINLGLRHILPVYALLAITAGYGVASLWNWGAHRRLALCSATVLLAWFILSSSAAHPDYLAYFNEAAGSGPEEITVGSDLDWGQDMNQLEEWLRERAISGVHLAYFGMAIPERHLRPVQIFDCSHPPPEGWVAISLSVLKTRSRCGWLQRQAPVARVGGSMNVYYISNGLSFSNYAPD